MTNEKSVIEKLEYVLDKLENVFKETPPTRLSEWGIYSARSNLREAIASLTPPTHPIAGCGVDTHRDLMNLDEYKSLPWEHRKAYLLGFNRGINDAIQIAEEHNDE